jgi:hypothetical protein
MIPDYKNKSLELIVREIDEVVYTEEFLPVVECPDKYHISSFGRLKKLSYKSRNIKKPDLCFPEKIIVGGLTNKGYVRVILKYGGKNRSRYAHRLVGLAFIPLIDGKPDINHKKCRKTDNHFTQLEWCTPQENNEHGVMMGVLKRGRTIKPKVYKRKEDKLHKPPIKVINIETGEIFNSTEELCNLKGLNIKSIRRQISGERYCYVPYRYVGRENDVKFKPVVIKPIKIPFVRPPKKVYIPHPITPKKMVMYDLNGNELRVFDSAKEAANHVKSTYDTFRRAIKKSPNSFTKGYIWKYA